MNLFTEIFSLLKKIYMYHKYGKTSDIQIPDYSKMINK